MPRRLLLVLLSLPLCAAAGCAPGMIGGSTFIPADSTWLLEKGFWLRREQALLHLSQREIAALDVDSMAQVLGRAPRVEVRQANSGLKQYLLHRSAGWASDPTDVGCPLDFYLNGSRLQIRSQGILEIQMDRVLRPLAITGVEIYDAARAPVGPADGCGAVLYWNLRYDDAADPEMTSSLHGRIVRLPGEEGVAGIEVTAEPGALRTTTDRNGRFDFGFVPAATYRVRAVVPDWGEYDSELPLRAGGRADMLIEVEKR
jgi:hypothetical protein